MMTSATDLHVSTTGPAALWEIFCSVVDNFGDIGICWRLSRQLVAEQGVSVRLWVDDLASFQRICPQVCLEYPQQKLQGVDVHLWHAGVNWHELLPATVVIEALACMVPLVYQQQMARQQPAPLWLNLEYLSAEQWVEGCHGVASPQPQLALNKYFFFPGFTTKTGGLLYEQELQQRLSTFMADDAAQHAFWQKLSVSASDYQFKVSMFAYSHDQVNSLLQQWQQLPARVLCVIPHGELALTLSQRYPVLQSGAPMQLGTLTLKVIPFLAQPDYDLLLAACDLNFVRGEDSIIRAHWAGRPFVWQIYRQQENAHLVKLQAFMHRYCQTMPIPLAKVVQQFYHNWNTNAELEDSWLDFYEILPQLADYNLRWRQQLLANGDLASNLVHFAKKKFIIMPNFSQQ